MKNIFSQIVSEQVYTVKNKYKNEDIEKCRQNLKETLSQKQRILLLRLTDAINLNEEMIEFECYKLGLRTSLEAMYDFYGEKEEDVDFSRYIKND